MPQPITHFTPGEAKQLRRLQISRRVFDSQSHILALRSGFHSEKNPMTGTAIGTKLIDNDRVTVWKWHFPKSGDNTGWHKHGHDYVVVPLTDGKLKITSAAGDTIAELKTGSPYFRSEGVEHDVINANEGEYAFIEIELK